MNHIDIQDIVLNPEDHSLQERDEAEAHLGSCGECRVVAEDWRFARALLSQRRIAPSEAFIRGVMERLENAAPIETGRNREWWAPAAALALAAAAALFTLLPRDRSNVYEEYASENQPAGPVDVLEHMMEEA
jgi:hypothetical protein